MGVGQHACLQVLGLGPKRALLGCSHQGATLPCITDQEIELPLVYDQPPCQPFSVSRAALGKFADNRAGLISAIGLPDFSLSLKRDDRFSNFERLQQARVCEKRQERRQGPTGICEMPSKPGRNDRVAGSLKFPFLDLGKFSANVSGDSAIDCHAGHMVGWIPEPLKIGFRFTHPLQGCRIAGIHINADEVPHIVVHRVPQPAVSVLHTSLPNVRKEAGWGWLPGVLFLGHDACGVVFSEGKFGKFGVA